LRSWLRQARLRPRHSEDRADARRAPDALREIDLVERVKMKGVRFAGHRNLRPRWARLNVAKRCLAVLRDGCRHEGQNGST
jgi:hypothetical protein